MKKITRTTAMILALVMIAGIFTGCISWWLITGEPLNLGNVSGEGALLLIFLPIADVVVLPVALVIFIIRAGIQGARDNRGKKLDGIDTFAEVIRSLPEEEYISLMRTFDSLSDAELASLSRRFYSLSKAEIDSYEETLKSFSEMELVAIVSAFSNLSQAEVVSSMKTLNSMPEKRLVSIMNDLRRVRFHY